MIRNRLGVIQRKTDELRAEHILHDLAIGRLVLDQRQRRENVLGAQNFLGRAHILLRYAVGLDLIHGNDGHLLLELSVLKNELASLIRVHHQVVELAAAGHLQSGGEALILDLEEIGYQAFYTRAVEVRLRVRVGEVELWKSSMRCKFEKFICENLQNIFNIRNEIIQKKIYGSLRLRKKTSFKKWKNQKNSLS